MKIKCLHGFFEFDEDRPGEVSDFISLFGLDLTFKAGRYVFTDLADAPLYSIAGAPYLGTTATATFEGREWEVMKANGVIYNFDSGLVVPISSVTVSVSLDDTGKYYFSPGLILPGSVTSAGDRVKEYYGYYSFDTQRFRYSEVGFV